MMNKKYMLAILVSILFSVTAGMVYHDMESEDLLANINLRIQEDNRDNTWRVRGNNGQNRGTLNSQRADKDRISWRAMGSDMVFTFNKDVNNYFEVDEGLFEDGYTQRLDANNRIRLTVREDAPADTLIYNVFVIGAQKFVVGNSPPRIIILGR